MSIWDEESWRKPVPKSSRELLFLKQKGKCARCKKSFASMRVKPILHHTGKSNQIRSMQLLCPNCHSKAHEIKVKEGDWGETYTVVKRKRFGKKKTVKERKKKKTTGDDWSW